MPMEQPSTRGGDTPDDWLPAENLPSGAKSILRLTSTPTTDKSEASILEPPNIWHDNFDPEFYDQLPRVRLTSRALKELDRRNKLRAGVAHRHPTEARTRTLPGLARFSRGGGPDMSDIRGYWVPGMVEEMPSGSTPPSREQGDATTREKERRQRRSSAYDANFKQHLVDHRILFPWYDGNSKGPQPMNYEEIMTAMKVPRPSLSLSDATLADWESLQAIVSVEGEHYQASKMARLLEGDTEICNGRDLPFLNVASITGGKTVKPWPDWVDGATLSSVDKRVRNDLSKIIQPRRGVGFPLAPNFYLEFKSPGGRNDVGVNQITLDGAHGALMMHSLQNYGREGEPIIYDGKAYALSALLHADVFSFFAHHLAPPGPDGAAGHTYHRTLLAKVCMEDSHEGYVRGMTAFQNSRELARDWRERFVDAANQRARELDREEEKLRSSVGGSPRSKAGSSRGGGARKRRRGAVDDAEPQAGSKRQRTRREAWGRTGDAERQGKPELRACAMESGTS